MTIRTVHARFLALLLAALMAGCAAPGGPAQPSGEQQVRFGTVMRIDATTIEGDHHTGLGAVIGAAAGGLLGSAIGQGSGRDVAMVLGALGGGFFGNDVQKKQDTQAGMHITVRLGNGVIVAITQPMDANIRVGDYVVIEGSGRDARVKRA